MNIQKHLEDLDVLSNSQNPLGSELSLLDLGYCIRLRGYYIDYANNIITFDKAQKLKDRLQKEYIQLHNKINQGLEVYKQYQEAIKKSELVRSDINKSSDINTMLLKALEYISLTTDDRTFYDINVRKF
ncbi:MAG: hypothetical protein KH373_01895 [Ruminococcus sp.]|nr:hypothetical protein [Ruminococcus sp.]